MRHKFSLALVAAFAVFPLGSAIAQVGQSGYSLPLALAVKAATKAIAVITLTARSKCFGKNRAS